MPRIALKVDADTLRGTQEGVPALLDVFARFGIRATFLFSLGPDHTGRAIARMFRPGFFAKVQRTSVVEHYGIRTLLYGTLLPGPDIGRRCADVMRSARDAGHEVGVHTWDHIRWQDHVRHKNDTWTRHEMGSAYARFEEIFGAPPTTHGAAGWQMNEFALCELDRWNLLYASDGRTNAIARGPYRVKINERILQCVQLPTTLPTFDELIGVDGMDASGAANHILQATSDDQDHVFTLHTELEGARLRPAFEQLLAGWQARGFIISSLGANYAALDVQTLPVLRFGWGSVAGRSGELMTAEPA